MMERRLDMEAAVWRLGLLDRIVAAGCWITGASGQ